MPRTPSDAFQIAVNRVRTHLFSNPGWRNPTRSSDMNRCLQKLAMNGEIQIRADGAVRAVNAEGNPITKAVKVEDITPRVAGEFSVTIEKPATTPVGASTDPDAGVVADSKAA